MEKQNSTGLKGIIQSLSPEAPGVIEGIVTSDSPIQITLANDAKMILGINSLVIPRHLTDHMVEVDLQKMAGSLESETLAAGADHTHELSTFSLMSGMLTIHNGLKKGDAVYLLQFNNGKKYYVLDRKG